MIKKAEIIVTAIELLAVLYVVIRSIRIMRHGNRKLVLALFVFGGVSLLLSLLYWITFDIMYPDIRMPLAANEFGEAAGYLFLASSLYELFRDDKRDCRKEMLCAALYAAASAGLWIAWSGEWLQDIIGGAAFGYLLVRCAQGLKLSGALGSRGRDLILMSFIIIAIHTGLFFVPEEAYYPVEYFVYVLMFIVLLGFLYLNIKAAAKKESMEKKMSLSFSGHTWCMSTMFMTDGVWYLAANLLVSVFILFMFNAVRGGDKS
ncbi:MAG: hypothetical protein IJM62_00125 [Lachnospiraceae bacterium]|nr:hypothetical protein [Lachnospiraceae bacterium]